MTSLLAPAVEYPDVADGQVPREPGQLGFVERVRHVPHRAGGHHPPLVPGRDAGALLAPVLQGVQAQVGHLGGLGVAVDAEDAALLAEFVGLGGFQFRFLFQFE